MLCSQCGEEMPNGSYFCGSCGNPVGYREMKAVTAVEEVGLEDVPAPIGSLERPGSSVGSNKKALCSICLGAYPVEELSVVDGRNRCAGCSPVAGRGGHAEHGGSGGAFGVPHSGQVAFHPRSVRHMDIGGRAGRGLKGVLAVLLLVLVGGGVFALLSGMGSDRIDRLLAGVDDGREDAILLVQKFEPGVPLTYDLEFSMHIEMEAKAGPVDQVVVDVSAKEIVVLEPMSVDEEGNAELRLTLRLADGDISMSMDGEKASLPGMGDLSFPKAVVLLVRVDPFGQPIGDVVVESIEGPIVGASDPSQWRIAAGLDDVPRHRVKVGDSWTNSGTFPFGGDAIGGLMAAGSMGGSATTTVEGFKKVLGRDCMVMSLKGSMEAGDIGGSLGAVLGGLDIEGKLKGAVFFDPEAGVLIRQAIDLDLTMSGRGPSGEMEVRANARIDLELQ